MLVFLDTEFTDFIDCDLISIGMVSEDGKQVFYAERSDFEQSWCNSFVRAAVLPQLSRAGPPVQREELQILLVNWFASLPRKIIVACDSYTDWELLLDALGNVRPPNLTGRYDLRSLIDAGEFHRAVVSYHKKYGQWHHAGHDAQAHRMGWIAWMNSRKSSRAGGSR